MLALAFAIRSQLTTKQGKVGLALLTLSGIGAASAAIFDLNQGTLHDVSGLLGYFGLPVPAMLITSARCRVQPWSAVRKQLLMAANLTWVSIVVWIVSFAVMIATFMLAHGALPSAPPDDLPAGVIALVGWTNRLAVLSAWAWVVIAACQAIKLQREGPVSSHEIISSRGSPIQSTGGGRPDQHSHHRVLDRLWMCEQQAVSRLQQQAARIAIRITEHALHNTTPEWQRCGIRSVMALDE